MITWKILNMQRLPSSGGNSDVVKNVYWCCYDSNENGDYGQCFGNEFLDTSSIESFVSWDSLTEDTVIGWVKAAIPADNMEMIEQAVQWGMDNAEHEQFTIGVPW